MPMRTAGAPLNFASLTLPPPRDYILGPDDLVEVTVHDLYPGGELHPLRAQVMGSGDIHLPLVGPVRVGGLNLLEAQAEVERAYANGFIIDARVNVYLAEASTTSVLVLGEVTRPGAYPLRKYESDVGHALAAAGGLTLDAETVIEVHRRMSRHEAAQSALLEELKAAEPGQIISLPDTEQVLAGPLEAENSCPPVRQAHSTGAMQIVRIPLRGFEQMWSAGDIVLGPGDVVVVPSRKDEIFFVVGKLSPTNFVRFNIGARERDLGAGFLLPRDREVDVVTAVAMAGYIDPIDSPTTVTVHRVGPDGAPLLIIVDLIAARYDRRETVLVQPGDIIYLNPDCAWWGRRTFDRIVGNLFGIRYSIR